MPFRMSTRPVPVRGMRILRGFVAGQAPELDGTRRRTDGGACLIIRPMTDRPGA